MVPQDPTFTKSEVVRDGFEAQCVDEDGVRYLWHEDCGLRVGADHRTTLLFDAGGLPEGPWTPTVLGMLELEGAGATA